MQSDSDTYHELLRDNPTLSVVRCERCCQDLVRRSIDVLLVFVVMQAKHSGIYQIVELPDSANAFGQCGNVANQSFHHQAAAWRQLHVSEATDHPRQQFNGISDHENLLNVINANKIRIDSSVSGEDVCSAFIVSALMSSQASNHLIDKLAHRISHTDKCLNRWCCTASAAYWLGCQDDSRGELHQRLAAILDLLDDPIARHIRPNLLRHLRIAATDSRLREGVESRQTDQSVEHIQGGADISNNLPDLQQCTAHIWHGVKEIKNIL